MGTLPDRAHTGAVSVGTRGGVAAVTTAFVSERDNVGSAHVPISGESPAKADTKLTDMLDGFIAQGAVCLFL